MVPPATRKLRLHRFPKEEKGIQVKLRINKKSSSNSNINKHLNLLLPWLFCRIMVM